MFRHEYLVRFLVFAGVLPFVAAAALVLMPLLPGINARALFDSYLLVILCFLCGSHWGLGLALPGRLPLNVFLLSNAMVLLLWLSHLLLPASLFQLVALAVLLLLLWVDRRLHAAAVIHTWYFIARRRVTLLVALCVGIVLLA